MLRNTGSLMMEGGQAHAAVLDIGGQDAALGVATVGGLEEIATREFSFHGLISYRGNHASYFKVTAFKVTAKYAEYRPYVS